MAKVIGSTSKKKSTCGQENVLCSNKHDRHGGPVEDVFDERKKTAQAATKAPAATTAPVANSVCFEHSNKTAPYQPNVATCDFNAGMAASMMGQKQDVR